MHDLTSRHAKLYTAELVQYGNSINRVDFCVFPEQGEYLDHEIGLALKSQKHGPYSVINIKRITTYWKVSRVTNSWGDRSVSYHYSPFYVTKRWEDLEYILTDMFIRSSDIISVTSIPWSIEENMLKAIHGERTDTKPL